MIKTNFKLIIIPIVVVLLLGGILLYFSINGQPKTVATYEQVWAAIENQGITLTDTTEMFKTAWNDRNDNKGETLQKALTFKNPDFNISFNFFVFDDDKSAHSARVPYKNYLRYDSGRFGTKATNQEYLSFASNFTVYWVKHDNFRFVLWRSLVGIIAIVVPSGSAISLGWYMASSSSTVHLIRSGLLVLM